MKRLFSLLLALFISISLSACQGNWENVNLRDAIVIPEDGIISKSIVEQIKNENAIGVFTGESNGFQYKWTIFGSDITDIKEINLQAGISQTSEDALTITLSQKFGFGFSALLSVHLHDRWDAQSATVCQGSAAVSSVSLTGTDHTILNLSTDGTAQQLVIRADARPQSSTVPTTPSTGKDQYQTDPIPEGKPKPVEPEDQDIDKGTAYTCTFSIECSTILNNLSILEPGKLEMVPSGGVILPETTITFYEGESVFDVLQRVCKDNGIHLESSWTPIYNSAYIEGIHNLYEFDCGELSGWMYRVNGWYPNYGCSRYQLKDGDVVQWRFTCDLGNDIGGGYATGG